MAAYAAIMEAARPDLTQYENMYRYLHANPELSDLERDTSAYVAEHLRKLSFDVFSNIGGYGIAAIFQNGSGMNVLLRSDMDALPVKENTGLSFSSKKKMKDRSGVEHSVMHACGHDMHMTCLLAACETLANCKDQWSGTLTVIFQPAEERGTGAQAMVDGGLYREIPVPDIVLGQHVLPFRSGRIGLRSGVIMGACDSFKVTLYGRAGHGSAPHTTIDPIVMASSLVIRLQNIVSREVNTYNDMAVVTVGSIHGGFAENIIPESAEIGIDIRTTNAATRDRILESIERKVRAEALASGAQKSPEIVRTRSFPATENDASFTKKIETSFRRHFGNNLDADTRIVPMSEDVSILATSQSVPCVFWHFGGIDQKLWDECEKEASLDSRIPSNHSDRFAPAIHPSLETGIDALCVAVLGLLGKN